MRALLLASLSALVAPPQDAEALLKSARERASRKDLVGAVIDYTRALALEPTLVEAIVGRGSARKDLQDLDGALADLTAALALDPRHAEARVLRGTRKGSRSCGTSSIGWFRGAGSGRRSRRSPS